MRSKFILLIGFIIFISITGCKEKEVKLGHETMGEFAPPDAFLEGEKHPYYGSENAWDQRFFYVQNKEFYKRRGQRQMLDLVKGRVQDTEDYCRELLAEDPNDLESLFNLAAALAIQDKIDEAMEKVKEAVDKGMPFERFLAGPKDILKPLTKSDEFQEYAANFNIQILHGPMVGRVTDQSASFWVRAKEKVTIQVQAATTELMRNAVLSNIVYANEKEDYTAIVDLKKLKADSKYYYQILVNGLPDGIVGINSFSTYPVKGKGSKFNLAFGGGAGYVPMHEHIWKVINDKHPKAFLFMGDNVYMNMPENPNGFHYYTYYRRQSPPDFRNLVASTSIYAIWDDHDAGTDDVWLGPYKDKPTWKLPLLDFFKQNWINPFYGSEEWPSCYFNFTIGDVEIFMLDGRFYRTNPFADNPTMLGPDQKAWLLDAIKKSTATFKVIASPVPWAYESKTDAKDTWNGFHKERTDIFKSLADNKIDGVFLISADRHRSDAWEIKRDNGYPLYEFMSSRLTNQHFHEIIPEALFGYNEKQSFGELVFDTDKENPTVTYNIYSIDNEKINSITLELSKLTHKE